MIAAELRAHILGANDLPTEKIYIPEWDATVYVRTISGTERDSFEAGSLIKRGKSRDVNLANLRARLVQLCAVDETGVQIFTPDDVNSLGAKSARALDKLFAVAQRINGFTEQDIEELTKN